MSYVYRGYGVTDSNGVAHLEFDENGDPLTHSYVGTGAGVVDFVASLDNPVVSGSLVSQNHPVYDAPVYDGDNTPATISWSKTNNAVLTDEVVSLTASVKNQNDNPCIHVPVTFVEEGTGSNSGTSRTLGTVYTDVYGDAVLTEVWTDATICDIVGSTTGNVSEDIRMFIKDKNNILSYNSWSGGDYLKNTDGTITSTCNVSVSNVWGDNGDLSFYVTAQAQDTSSNSNVLDLFRFYKDTYDNGNYTLELTVYNLDQELSVVLYNQSNVSRVNVMPSNTPIRISLSGELDNSLYCSCRIVTINRIESYFDNIQLSKN